MRTLTVAEVEEVNGAWVGAAIAAAGAIIVALIGSCSSKSSGSSAQSGDMKVTCPNGTTATATKTDGATSVTCS